MIDERAFKKIAARIDSYREAMIEMQISLTAIPAISPESGGDGEYEKARYITDSLINFGFSAIKEINAPDGRVSKGFRPNITAKISGKNAETAVWILTHMDIVPPGEMKLWDRPPYEGYELNGRLYGRGAEDNQQDLVASIFAAKAFLDEGIMPESTIGLVFVADEETSSDKGISHVLESAENPFRKTDIIVVPDAGNSEGTMIETAEKSILWLRVETKGKQGHGSRPSSGNNAFAAASHLVVELNALHALFGDVDPLYDPPASTFQPTKKEANVPNVNTIPGEDVFYMDCRVLPCYDLHDVIAAIGKTAAALENRFGVTVTVSPVQHRQAPPPTAPDAPVVLALAKAVRDVYQVQAHPQGIGAGTVAAYFRKHGYPAAVWSRMLQTAHQPNEHCLVANMMGNAKVYAHMFLQK